jgi:hypothetical protein
MPRSERFVRRFREHLHHSAVLGQPGPAPRFVGRASLFSSAILLAPAVPVGLPGSRISQEFMTDRLGLKFRNIDILELAAWDVLPARFASSGAPKEWRVSAPFCGIL